MADEPANTVLYDVSEGLATITINRPDAMNAMNTAAKVALRDALLSAGADAGVRAVLLTATGRAFCVGQDLKEHVATLRATREAGGGNALSTVQEHYNPIVRAITEMAKPVVAGVNGVAAGPDSGSRWRRTTGWSPTPPPSTRPSRASPSPPTRACPGPCPG